jgi:hypothetical protein
MNSQPKPRQRIRSRSTIMEYQRKYYLLCIAVDQAGMRQQWREAKRKKKSKLQEAIRGKSIAA